MPPAIECTASTHRAPGNPLAANGRLEAVCGVEYASQAMALHGALAGCGDWTGVPEGGVSEDVVREGAVPPGEVPAGEILRRGVPGAGLAGDGLAGARLAVAGFAGAGFAGDGPPESGLSGRRLSSGEPAGSGQRPRAGYLASSREVVCSVERLDLLAGDLRITAELLIANAARVIYRFTVTCDDAPVLSGRAAVVLDIGPPT